jgi:hypothetical protein
MLRVDCDHDDGSGVARLAEDCHDLPSLRDSAIQLLAVRGWRLMQHRHLNTTEWTLAAVDSVLERGDVADWRELFEAVRGDRGLAQRVLQVVNGHDLGGAGVIARATVLRLWPVLGAPSAGTNS